MDQADAERVVRSLDRLDGTWSGPGPRSLSLGTPRRRLLTAVVVPAALPAFLTGACIALVGATVGVFLGETIVGAHGIGHLMAVGYRTLETSDVHVAIITISVIGFALDRTFLLLRRQMLALER